MPWYVDIFRYICVNIAVGFLLVCTLFIFHAHRSRQCPPVFGCSSGRNGINVQRSPLAARRSPSSSCSCGRSGQRRRHGCLQPNEMVLLVGVCFLSVGVCVLFVRCRRETTAELIDLFDSTKLENGEIEYESRFKSFLHTPRVQLFRSA